jgi:hypothetical protein
MVLELDMVLDVDIDMVLDVDMFLEIFYSGRSSIFFVE